MEVKKAVVEVEAVKVEEAERERAVRVRCLTRHESLRD